MCRRSRGAAALLVVTGLALLDAPFSAGAYHAAQTATFSARKESVRLEVLVTDRNGPLKALGATDFELLDSGVTQDIELVSYQQLPLNIILAVDASASVSGDRLLHLRDGGRALLANMEKDDQAALVTFTHAVDVRSPLTPDATRVEAALAQLRVVDRVAGTSLFDALYASLTLADSDPGRSLIIVFTDGVDTASWLAAERVLQAARRSNVVVYVVSPTVLPRRAVLREVVDQTGGDAFTITAPDKLRVTFLAILDEFRQRYLVSYSPAGVPEGGWHPLTVRVKGRKASVKARAGYAR